MLPFDIYIINELYDSVERLRIWKDRSRKFTIYNFDITIEYVVAGNIYSMDHCESGAAQTRNEKCDVFYVKWDSR